LKKGIGLPASKLRKGPETPKSAKKTGAPAEQVAEMPFSLDYAEGPTKRDSGVRRRGKMGKTK